MPYRDQPPQPKTGKSVEVRSYMDLVAAELARVQLESKGIPSQVVQTASFNPMLVGATGGHKLVVDGSDAERADEVLRRVELNTDVVDEEPEGTVRCPRCEGAYCHHGRPPLNLLHMHLVPLLIVALPYWLLAPKRWYCARCDHVWKDASEGPRKITRLAPEDPRPVFLLWRGHAGPGLFFGALAGVLVALFAPRGGFGVLALPLLAFAGWYFGRVLGKFVCSEPGCRAELTPDAESCPRCHGAVAGRVRWAAEHHAAAADFRRELVAEAARPRKKKGARLLAAPKVR